MPLVAGHEPTIVEEPREESLDLPSPLVAPENATILRVLPSTAADVRCNHLSASVLEFTVELVAVVSLVADQKMRRLANDKLHLVERGAHESGFMRRSTVDPNSDRKTSAVCNGHDLGPLPALRRSDADPPFLAPAKEPSMKASVMSIPPRSRRSLAISLKIASSSPLSAHSWNQRWQVWYGGYRGGRSFHGAPVRSTHRMPFMIARGSCRGRPGVPSFFQSSKNGSRSFHCSSVRSTASVDQNLARLSIPDRNLVNSRGLALEGF